MAVGDMRNPPKRAAGGSRLVHWSVWSRWSTLLNALVGRDVLPTGVVPVTAIPTILRFGDRPSARVRFAGGSSHSIGLDQIGEYVSEAANSDNFKGVEDVEILLPAPLLRFGMCPLDTPGLGSIFEAATGSTHAFVPHIDAALVVVGADPPISADEAALVEIVAKQVGDIVTVLSKADRVTEAERQEAISFTKSVLSQRLRRPVGSILEVSARERLESGPTRDWRLLVEFLGTLADRSGSRLVQAARERGAKRLGHRLISLAEQTRGALLAPIEAAEQRLARLHDSTGAIEERLRYLGYTLAAEQARVRAMLEERQQRFVESTWPLAAERLGAELERRHKLGGPALRRQIAEFARAMAEELVMPWLGQEEEFAETLYQEVASRFVDAANAFLTELGSVDEESLDSVPDAIGAEEGFRAKRGFYFYRFETYFVSASPLHWLVDALGPPGWVRRRIRHQAREFLHWLLEANSTRVQNDLTQRVEESRRRLEREIRVSLAEARTWAEAVIARTRAMQDEGADAVARELARLDRIGAELRLHAGGPVDA